MTNATAAAVATARKAKKVSHPKPDNLELTMPTPAAPEFGMMAPDSILVLDQMRKEFDEDALRELAADIARRGILQPLTVRKTDAGFVLVAGERRLRAARMAKLDAVPVLVCAIEDTAHQLTQLAENIQRQDLTLTEEAAAVRQLKDAGQSVSDIAASMHKSKSWVSKRLAASSPGLAWPAAKLIEEQITEDLELILAIDQACKLDFYEDQKLARTVHIGKPGRETVRTRLAEIKALDAARRAAREERDAKENDPELKAKRDAERNARAERIATQQAEESQSRHINPQIQMGRFWDWCSANPDEGGSAWLTTRDGDQTATLGIAIDQWYAAGQGMNAEQLASRAVMEYIKSWNNIKTAPDFALAAMAYGMGKTAAPCVMAEFLDCYKGRIISVIPKQELERDASEGLQP